VLRIITAVAALVGLAVLGLLLSASAIATGVIFGVFAGVVVALAGLNINKALSSSRQSGPRYYITHQHIHLHAPQDAPQVSEPERHLTIR